MAETGAVTQEAPVQAGTKLSVERKPGELLTPLKAVRSHCLGCCNGAAEVALCTVTSCPLWPYRFGTRTRAHRIVAEERKRGDLGGRHWAEELDDYTSGRYYQNERATRQREKARA